MKIRAKKTGNKSRDPACKFLEEPTGELRKLSCKTKPKIVEHFCSHPDRQRTKEETVFRGRCTPHNKNHEFRQNIPIQPCYLCVLYQPKL